MKLAPGAEIEGSYRLERPLGEGGMGVVWAAVRIADGARVALKVLHSTDHDASHAIRRFLREAQAAQAVDHEGVVEVLEVVRADGVPIIVMPLLEGETLRQRLAREERLALSEAAPILRHVASALRAAHGCGIVHRDVKPENVFLVRGTNGRGAVKVIDFGVSKLVSELGGSPMSGKLTHTGARVGTPWYMAPEQARGEPTVDARADVWALGVLTYECLAGCRPVEGANQGQVLQRLLSQAITPLEHVTRGVPAHVAALVGRMLSLDPAERPSLDEIDAELAP